MKKPVVFFVAILLMLFNAAQLSAGEAEKRVAKEIGGLLIEEFKPDSLKLKISDGGSFIWAEMVGANIEAIRIENMKLRAMLKEAPKQALSGDKYGLANLIMMSEGEVVLLEKDVNNYFLAGINTKGFSNLKFDFTPEGFSADGIFSAKFLFTIKIRLKAKGVLGLQADGVYLENTAIYVEGVKQPESLTSMIIGKVNPLLPFKKIPFPVSFKKIKMTDTSAIMTSDPKPFTKGESWSWHK
ncbi:MAG: hypothetical protein LLF78_01305 [Synergistaceae bacterium]|nr:hypothetical protein [Synergistaceae bacterium]